MFARDNLEDRKKCLRTTITLNEREKERNKIMRRHWSLKTVRNANPLSFLLATLDSSLGLGSRMKD